MLCFLGRGGGKNLNSGAHGTEWRENFFTGENQLSFPPELFLGVWCSSGWANFTPTRWYPSVWVTRTARARKVREALGKVGIALKGALGISSKTCAERGMGRRTATRAPAAEMLSAVANSRNSLPFSSRLRTNTGIASGRRGHLRRSVSGFRRLNAAPLSIDLAH
jgi:hypothetical protein